MIFRLFKRLLSLLLFFQKKRDWLYEKQAPNSNICMPLSIYNACVYKNITPPSLYKLKKLCKWDKNGSLMVNVPDEYLENTLGLVPTKHSNVVLKKGGILIINSDSSDNVMETHATFCTPNRKVYDGNKKNNYNTFINVANNCDKVSVFKRDDIVEYLPKFGNKHLRGYYFK